MKVKSEREVAQSCPTLSDPMDCNLPGSSIHGIFQARVLEWGAIAVQLQLLQCTGWGIGFDYCDIEWFALEMNRNLSVIFEIVFKYCI